MIALCAVAPAYAQSVDATLDSIIKDSKENFEKLTALDKSDKALKISNDAQVFSTKAANKMEERMPRVHCKWKQTAPISCEANFWPWGVPNMAAQFLSRLRNVAIRSSTSTPPCMLRFSARRLT